MVSFAPETVEKRISLAQAAQHWWSVASPLCSSFFKMSTQVKNLNQIGTQERLLREMATIYKRIEQIPSSMQIAPMRKDLLKAMVAMMNTLSYEMYSNDFEVRQNLDDGLVHMLRFTVALEQFNLNF